MATQGLCSSHGMCCSSANVRKQHLQLSCKVNFIIATSHKVYLIECYEHLFLLYTDADCGFYKFEVHKDKVDREQIVRAELHLFQTNSPVPSGHYHVHIYYLLRARDMESPLKLTSKHVSSTPGWKTFDITLIAESWKEQGWVNHGLKIKLTTKDDEVLPCDGVFADEDNEPSLVIYTNDQDSKFFEGLLKKEEKSVVQQPRRKRNSQNADVKVKVNNVGCHRKELIVKRKHLSGHNIQLVLPFEFDAGVCEGHCKRLEQSADHPMSYTSIVSLHYLHTVGLEAAPSRCCVPISYDNVMMMFRDKNTHQRIFKKYVPARVRECGCL